MEKPLCKICKERHYGLCNEFAAKVGSSDAKPTQAQPRAKADRPSIPRKERSDVARSVTPIPETGGRDKAKNGTFDRVAYQREYMRKRRAAK